MRLCVIEREQVVSNVSAVCRELRISRTLFYRASTWNGTAPTVSYSQAVPGLNSLD